MLPAWDNLFQDRGPIPLGREGSELAKSLLPFFVRHNSTGVYRVKRIFSQSKLCTGRTLCVRCKIPIMDKKHRLSKSDVIKDIPLACANELTAVEFFEAQRWGDTPACVHCGSVSVYKMV